MQRLFNLHRGRCCSGRKGSGLHTGAQTLLVTAFFFSSSVADVETLLRNSKLRVWLCNLAR